MVRDEGDADGLLALAALAALAGVVLCDFHHIAAMGVGETDHRSLFRVRVDNSGATAGVKRPVTGADADGFT
jgi:hypothetical protein